VNARVRGRFDVVALPLAEQAADAYHGVRALAFAGAAVDERPIVARVERSAVREAALDEGAFVADRAGDDRARAAARGADEDHVVPGAHAFAREIRWHSPRPGHTKLARAEIDAGDVSVLGDQCCPVVEPDTSPDSRQER